MHLVWRSSLPGVRAASTATRYRNGSSRQVADSTPTTLHTSSSERYRCTARQRSLSRRDEPGRRSTVYYRPLLVRQASFGAGEIPSGAISDGRKLAK